MAMTDLFRCPACPQEALHRRPRGSRATDQHHWCRGTDRQPHAPVRMVLVPDSACGCDGNTPVA